MLIASMIAFLMASVDNPFLGYRGPVVFSHAVGWINTIACIIAIISALLFFKRKTVAGIVLGIFVVVCGVAFSLFLLYRPFVGNYIDCSACFGFPLITISLIALVLARFECSNTLPRRGVKG